jgi:AcrR family transcriptional regulator
MKKEFNDPDFSRHVTKGLETKEKILREAVELFSEYGFARASTRQLVKRVGMTSSAIYNHFENKDEILFIIINRAGDKVLAMLEEATKRYDDPVECLKQMIKGMLALFRVDVMSKELAIFIDELYQLPKNLRYLCDQQHRRIFDLFRDKIDELDQMNLINPINPTVATFGLIGSMLWVYHWFRDNGELSMDEISDNLVNMLFHGLLSVDMHGPKYQPVKKIEVKC